MTHRVPVLAGKRLRQHLGLFVAIAVVVAIVSGLGLALVGYLSDAADVGVRQSLALRSGAAIGLEISQQLSPDADTQDRAIRDNAAVAYAGVPFGVERTLGRNKPIPLLTSDGADSGRAAVLMSLPDLPERAELSAGAWPTADGGVSVQADAAQALGLEVGDRLRIGEADLAVTGLWTALDPIDPRWLGDPLIGAGSDDDRLGPIVIAEPVWGAVGEIPDAHWAFVPDVAEIDADDLAALAQPWREVRETLRRSGELDDQPLVVGGALDRTAADLLGQVSTLNAARPVALLVVIAIAVLTLLELSRLLSAARAAETELLWSRGASAPRIGLTAAGESALVAALGAAAGLGAALGVLAVAAPGYRPTPDTLLVAGVAPVLAAALLFGGEAYLSARRAVTGRSSAASGRGRSVAGLGAVSLVVIAAGISTWQLLLYGSPVTPTADGGSAVDPVAVLAPSLLVVALCLVALLAFPLLARAVERAAVRGSVTSVLASRNLSRRLQLAATTIVLVSLACGQLVVAAGYSATWSASFATTEQVRTGAALRVVHPGGIGDDALDRIIALDGVALAAPATVDDARFGQDFERILGVAPRALAELANEPAGLFNAGAAARAIETDAVGPPLPAGASVLEISARSTLALETAPGITVRLVDALGWMREVVMAPTADGGGFGYRAELPAPPAGGSWRIAALDVSLPSGALSAAASAPVTFELLSLTADATTLEDRPYWIATGYGDRRTELTVTAGGSGFQLDPYSPLVRLVPSFDGAGSDVLLAPVVVSRALADRYNIEVGSGFPIVLGDSAATVTCTVIEIVGAVPGVDDSEAMLIDLGILNALQLRVYRAPLPVTQVWLDAGDSVVAALREQLPAGARIESASSGGGREMLGSTAVALWLGAAAAVVLAAIALGVVIGAQLRSRRAESRILRAVGMSSGMLARIRRREFGLVAGYALFAGAIAGAIVTVVTVPLMARASIPAPLEAVPTPVRFDPVTLGGSLAFVALAVLLVIAVYGSAVARQSLASGRDEVR